MKKVTLSQDILIGISNLANELNFSVDELLKQIIQRKLTVIDAEELEDLLDIRDAILADNDTNNQERIAWEDVKKELNL